jgi:hypothetical protein
MKFALSRRAFKRAAAVLVAGGLLASTGTAAHASTTTTRFGPTSVAAVTAAPVAGPHLLKPRSRAVAKPAVVITGPLTNHGNPVQTAPRVYVVFWGWTSDPAGEKLYLIKFLQSVGGTPWLATVNQYGGGSSAGLLAGVWTDPSAIPASPTDTQIQQEASATLDHFAIADSLNLQIVVATPTGHSTAGFGTSFCAYHSVAPNFIATYTNLPYQTDAGAACGQNAVTPGSGGILDGVSIVEGHELAETITDPNQNAWRDAGANEIGDKCAWNGLGGVTLSGVAFPMQTLWSNGAGGCVMSSPRWSNWASEIGAPPPGIAAGSAPTVSTWGGSRLDVFVRGTDNAIWHAWWDGTRWNTWESLGPTIVSNPTAVSWAPGRIDLFGIGADGNVWHKYYGGTWGNWVSEIGAPPPGIAAGSSPAVSSWGTNRLDVFVRGNDNAIWHAWWDGTQWYSWQSLGATIVSSPAAVAAGPNLIDLFGVGTNGNVWHKYYGYF